MTYPQQILEIEKSLYDRIGNLVNTVCEYTEALISHISIREDDVYGEGTITAYGTLKQLQDKKLTHMEWCGEVLYELCVDCEHRQEYFCCKKFAWLNDIKYAECNCRNCPECKCVYRGPAETCHCRSRGYFSDEFSWEFPGAWRKILRVSRLLWKIKKIVGLVFDYIGPTEILYVERIDFGLRGIRTIATMDYSHVADARNSAHRIYCIRGSHDCSKWCPECEHKFIIASGKFAI